MARMMLKVIVVETSITLVAKVRSAQESFEGIAPIVVVTLFDDANDLVGGCGANVDDHVWWGDGNDLDLVPW